VPALGADCPLDADLAGALLHHHVHDVGHTNPGDEQGHAADYTQKDVEAEKDLLLLGDELGRVPDKEGLVVRGVEAVFAAQHPEDLLLDPLALEGIGRLENDAVEIAPAVNAVKGGVGDDRAAVVRPVVHRGLQLFRQDADDGEGQAVHLAALANRALIPEKLSSDLAAEKKDAPFLLQVHLVEKAAACGRVHPAHELEIGIDRLHIGQGGAAAVAQAGAVFALLGANLRDHGNALPEQLRVGLGKADATADRQSLILDRGLIWPDGDNAVSRIEQPLTHAKGEAGAEGHQQDHHHGAPGDGEGGEESAQLLLLDVLDEFSEQHPDMHGDDLVLG